jgi:molybdate transport system substrate-binding protein
MAEQLKVISSMATCQILADLIRLYEQQTGCRVTIKSTGGVDAARSVRAGEPTDVILLASNVMEQLEAEGYIGSGSRTDFARSGIAMAVRAGAQLPCIYNDESVKQAVLEARKICYSTGPSGDHLMKLWERWGILGTISERAIQAPPGVPVAVLVARGDADLGFQQLSELLHFPGIHVVGPLPAEIQATTVFSVGVSSSSSSVESARGLVAFLNSPEADAVKRKHGMDPASQPAVRRMNQ